MIDNQDEIKQVDLLFHCFRYNINKLMDLEDELAIISDELSGSLKSPTIRSSEEALYQRGTVIYKNNISELIYEEEKLIEDRNYYLYSVKRVESILKMCNDTEVNLLELRYYYNYSIRKIAEITNYSKSQIFRMLKNILLKVM